MISELICALVLTAMALRITTWLAAPWRALVAGVTLLVALLPIESDDGLQCRPLLFGAAALP